MYTYVYMTHNIYIYICFLYMQLNDQYSRIRAAKARIRDGGAMSIRSIAATIRC